MLAIPYAANYGENLEKRNGNASGYQPCVCCGKGVKDENVRWVVHTYYGSYIVTDAEADDLRSKETPETGYGDTGNYPIGSDCLRKHPEIKPYVKKVS